MLRPSRSVVDREAYDIRDAGRVGKGGSSE